MQTEPKKRQRAASNRQEVPLQGKEPRHSGTSGEDKRKKATEQEIRSLFEQYGKVLVCDIIKNYGFVLTEDKTAAEDAVCSLHHYSLHGVNINVEASKSKSKTSTKLHVGNISPTCINKELPAKFEEHGLVIQSYIIKDYAFAHMERAEEAVEAIRGLDNTGFSRQMNARKVCPPAGLGLRPGWETRVAANGRELDAQYKRCRAARSHEAVAAAAASVDNDSEQTLSQLL
ncbi:hypothetical protein P7K49_000266 [Saguinus oedipus]|uniref:RRM domain-containing protein n=1 Tax=Saguinus oedipus TaxID=9490 RepID=A0ABQ9WB48_SAGOE|nr:hypothetical protein P7K49_000266 [Saguinus oedipus]